MGCELKVSMALICEFIKCADLVEDNVLVTEDGHDNLTTAVKDVDAMERIIQEFR